MQGIRRKCNDVLHQTPTYNSTNSDFVDADADADARGFASDLSHLMNLSRRRNNELVILDTVANAAAALASIARLT